MNRTFILDENSRDRVSKLKYIYNKDNIHGRKIVIVDDSIVRGITMNNIISRLWEYGAIEVHIRICAPEVKDVCHYGININSKKELVSAKHSPEEINESFKSTTLKFLDINTMMSAISSPKPFCTGCFNSNYGGDVNTKRLEW